MGVLPGGSEFLLGSIDSSLWTLETGEVDRAKDLNKRTRCIAVAGERKVRGNPVTRDGVPIAQGALTDGAVVGSLDGLWFKLHIGSGPRLSGAHVAIHREITTSEQCRAVFIEMLRAARQRASP